MRQEAPPSTPKTEFEPLTRHMSAGLEPSLQQFANAELLESGCVSLIALDAVVERLGAKWALRREQVHDHVTATLDRELGSQGYHLRVSDTDFLISQPDCSRFAAQANCLRLLREVLQHFLGTDEQAELGVHQVTQIGARGVEARRIDLAAARAEEEAKATGPEAGEASASAPAADVKVDIWTPFVASNGCLVEVSCELEDVLETRGVTGIGWRLARRVFDGRTGREFGAEEMARLSRSDRLRIDLGGLARGLALVRAQQGKPRPAAIVVPMSFSSLSNLEGRAQIVGGCKEAETFASQGVIAELCQVDGVPAVTLIDAVSMVKPHSLFVIGHCGDPNRGNLRALKDAGFHGISIVCPVRSDGAALITWLQTTVATAKQFVRSILLYRLPSERHVGLARAYGATHASTLESRGAGRRSISRSFRPAGEVAGS